MAFGGLGYESNEAQMTPVVDKQSEEKVLSVSNLKTHFFTREGVIRAVDGVDFSVNRGEIFGLVGESGCGKSVTSLSILRLVPDPPGKIVDGRIEFLGKDILSLSRREMRKMRGERISMIFQDPLSSLNPVLTIGYQMSELFRFHKGLSRADQLKESIRMMRATEIPSSEERIRQYPHEMSGGLRQRVMIGMGLACEPELLIADEPTTALDVTVQAQVLQLIKNLCRERRTAVILITHDMGVIANMCHRVAVMYAGRVVEQADVYTLFRQPVHPYTQGLLRSLPKLDQKQDRLYSIEGQPPALNRPLDGCSYADRCFRAEPRCREESPELRIYKDDHQVRCHFPLEGNDHANR